MSFLNPYVLWFSLLAAVPLLIHFFNRKETSSVEFPSIILLKPATDRVLRKIELLQLILLIIRMLIILLLVAAFSRPIWKSSNAESDIVNNIILIDNSYSMNCSLGQATALEYAKKVALELAEGLNGDISVATFNEDLESVYPFTSEKAQVSGKINEILPSSYSTDLISSLNSIASHFNDKESTQLSDIFILSDFNAAGMGKMVFEDHPFFNRIFLIDVSDITDNFWIEHCGFKTAYKDIPVEFSADIRASSEKLKGLRASLWVDGIKRREVFLDNSVSSGLDFSNTFKDSGEYSCILNINAPDDKLQTDNNYYFSVKVRPEIRILVAEGKTSYNILESETYFLVKALSPDNFATPLSVKVVSVSELQELSLNDYDILFIMNAAMNRDITEKVMDYHYKGGNLAVFLGDNTERDAYNSFLNYILPVKIESKAAIKPASSLEISSVEYSELFEKPVRLAVKKIFTSRNTGNNLRPVLKAGDIPLVWMSSRRNSSDGNFALFTLPLNLSWSELPLKSSFAPLMHRITYDLIERKNIKSDEHYLNPGMLLKEEDKTAIYYEELDYEEKLVKKLNRSGRLITKPGIYKAGEENYYSNLKTSSGESTLTKLTQKDMSAMLKKKYIYFDFSTDLGKKVLLEITGREKGRLFMALAVILLLLEEILRKILQSHNEKQQV